MADPLLPGQHGQLADKEGRATRDFYGWFQWIQKKLATVTTTVTETAAAVAAIPPQTTVTGSTTVDVFGSPDSGYTVALHPGVIQAGQMGPPGRDGEPGEDAMPIPGPRGDAGAAGVAGAQGAAIWMVQDPIEPDWMPIPGPKGDTGASGGQSAIQFKDEGSALGASGTVDTVDFVGSGVVATRVGNVVTATIAGGGSAGAGAQVGYAYTESSTTASTSTTTPAYDNTKPQNTEGDAYASLDTTINVSAATSLLEITVRLPMISQTAVSSPRFALFRDSTADSIFSTAVTVPAADYLVNLVFTKVVAASSTGNTTFKLRWGCGHTGTAYLNRGSTTASLFNGTVIASMTIREIAQ